MEQSEYAREVLATIKQLEDEMARLKAQIERTKDTIEMVALRGLNETKDEVRQNLMWELYWNHTDTVSTAILAEVLNVRINAVGSHIADAYLTVTCSKCQNQFKVKVKSRAKLREQRADSWRLECPECKAAAEAQFQANRQEAAQRAAQLDTRLEELRTMPYREYLKTPEWQATRERKLKRARYRCELCFKAGKLNVHHKTYERRGNEDDRDLIVLCGTCHAKFHDKLVEE